MTGILTAEGYAEANRRVRERMGLARQLTEWEVRGAVAAGERLAAEFTKTRPRGGYRPTGCHCPRYR